MGKPRPKRILSVDQLNWIRKPKPTRQMARNELFHSALAEMPRVEETLACGSKMIPRRVRRLMARAVSKKMFKERNNAAR